MGMINKYASYVRLSSANADAALATALAYDNAIGDEESMWLMPEPTIALRFCCRITTATVVTTEPKVALFRRYSPYVHAMADDTSASAAFMTDSGEAFTVDGLIGWTIYNITDGSSAVITDNTATTVTGTLSGGTDNDWDSGDKYVIGYKLAEITIPNGATLGSIYYKDIANTYNVSGTGITTSTSTDYYKRRGPAEIFAGEQLVVVSTVLGVGSAGAFQPYVICAPMAEYDVNQAKMIESA